MAVAVSPDQSPLELPVLEDLSGDGWDKWSEPTGRVPIAPFAECIQRRLPGEALLLRRVARELGGLTGSDWPTYRLAQVLGLEPYRGGKCRRWTNYATAELLARAMRNVGIDPRAVDM